MRKQLLFLLLAGTLALSGCGEETQTPNETKRSVEVTEIARSSIASQFTYSGKTAPSKEITVIPTIGGKVTGKYYDIGDYVRAGATLFQVDTTDLQLSVKSLEANRATAELALENAKATYDSNLPLYEAQIISESDFRQIKYAYESAQASLASLDVQAETLQKNIADCSVTSPISGYVTACNVETGAMASQAGTSYTISDLSTLLVSVGVSEQVVNTIHVGDEVSVTISAYAEAPLKGTVKTINPAASATGTYAVEISLPNPDGQMKSGMLSEVAFLAEESNDTIVLPHDVVINKDGETYVFLAQPDNTVKKSIVTTGIDTGDMVEILTGVAEGDLVVTKGQSYLSDGEAVEILNASSDETTNDTTGETTPDETTETTKTDDGKEG